MRGFSLGTQNKTFLSDNKDLLVMLVRVAPYLGLGLISGIFGYQLGGLIPATARIYIQIAFLGSLFVLIILDKEPGWNVVLFICFGIAAGMILFHSVSDLTRVWSWILFIMLLLVSLFGGSRVNGVQGRAAGILFISTLLYIIGWVLLSLIQVPSQVGEIWTILGLALFTFIAMNLISQGKNCNSEESAIPLSVQLYVVLFNLYWLSFLLELTIM